MQGEGISRWVSAENDGGSDEGVEGNSGWGLFGLECYSEKPQTERGIMV